MAERVTNGRARTKRTEVVLWSVPLNMESEFFIIIQNSKAELGSG